MKRIALLATVWVAGCSTEASDAEATPLQDAGAEEATVADSGAHDTAGDVEPVDSGDDGSQSMETLGAPVVALAAGEGVYYAATANALFRSHSLALAAWVQVSDVAPATIEALAIDKGKPVTVQMGGGTRTMYVGLEPSSGAPITWPACVGEVRVAVGLGIAVASCDYYSGLSRMQLDQGSIENSDSVGAGVAAISVGTVLRAPNQVLTADTNGALRHFTGGGDWSDPDSWPVLAEIDAGWAVQAVAPVGGEGVLIVGRGGFAAYHDGSSFERVDAGVVTDLFAACGTSQRAYALGSESTLLRFSGGSFEPLEVDLEGTLSALACGPQGEVVVGSEAGEIVMVPDA